MSSSSPQSAESASVITGTAAPGHAPRVVHVRGLNHAFRVLNGKTGIDFITGALDYFGVTVVTRGDEHLHEARRALAVANHPLGGMDGMALMQSVSKRLGDTQAPVNDLLMNLPQLQELLVPVNKRSIFPLAPTTKLVIWSICWPDATQRPA